MRRLAAIFLAVVSLFATSAMARDPIRVELLNGGYVGGSQTALLGLKVTLDDGWHTYWKSAGEGGFPPSVDASRSSNVETLELRWPAPERVETGGEFGKPALQTNGYTKGVMIPVLMKPRDEREDVNVELGIRIFACKDLCAAFDIELAASVGPGYLSASEQKEIVSGLRKVPRITGSGLQLSDPVNLGNGKFEIELSSDNVVSSPWLHVADSRNTPYRVEIIDATPSEAPTRVRFAVSPEGGPFEEAGGIEIVGTAGIASVSALKQTPTGAAPIGIEMLLTAMLGGLVLNLMPCVFPVLSLKLMSLTKANVKEARLGFFGSSLGIVASFLALAVALAGLKSFGIEIGWGIQFQNLFFLSLMIVVVVTFAANTAGLFEIGISGNTATWLTRRTQGHGFAASVGQGFVATLLATPCSAPFVGTAVGFALAGSTTDILSVFLAMGVGMALPFAAISVLPGLAVIMPRPGKWMNDVKALMSLALFGTAGWLATTLLVISAEAAWIMVALTISAILAILLRQRDLRGIGFAILAAASFTLPAVLERAVTEDMAATTWQAFEPGRIASLVADGDTVVVNMTAKWCLTCTLNERTTWSNREVKSALGDTVAMQGDWTKPDPAILSFLRANGRFGIPFTVVYTKENPSGKVLPEILSPSVVIDVLNSGKVATEVSN